MSHSPKEVDADFEEEVVQNQTLIQGPEREVKDEPPDDPGDTLVDLLSSDSPDGPSKPQPPPTLKDSMSADQLPTVHPANLCQTFTCITLPSLMSVIPCLLLPYSMVCFCACLLS